MINKLHLAMIELYSRTMQKGYSISAKYIVMQS